MKEILYALFSRYKEMVSSDSKIYNMIDYAMIHCFDDNMPVDKLNRWLGYIQCYCINILEITTDDDERDFSRPLFQQYYEDNDIKFCSVNLKEENK